MTPEEQSSAWCIVASVALGFLIAADVTGTMAVATVGLAVVSLATLGAGVVTKVSNESGAKEKGCWNW